MDITKKVKLKKQKQSRYSYPTFTNPITFDSLHPQNYQLPDKQNFWTSEKISLLLTFMFFSIVSYNYVFYDVFTSLHEFYNAIFYDSLDSIVHLLYRNKGSSVLSNKNTSALFDLVMKNPSNYPSQAVTCLSLSEILKD